MAEGTVDAGCQTVEAELKTNVMFDCAEVEWWVFDMLTPMRPATISDTIDWWILELLSLPVCVPDAVAESVSVEADINCSQTLLTQPGLMLSDRLASRSKGNALAEQVPWQPELGCAVICKDFEGVGFVVGLLCDDDKGTIHEGRFLVYHWRLGIGRKSRKVRDATVATYLPEDLSDAGHAVPLPKEVGKYLKI